MNITKSTSILELNTINVMDFISDGVKKGRVTHIATRKTDSVINYQFEIYAEKDGEYNKDHIYCIRPLE